MPISLPQFGDSFCQLFGVCSHIIGPAPESLPEEDIDITTGYSSPDKALARLIWDRDTKHFHVDTARKAMFGKTPPKQDERLPAFRKMLARFEGLNVKAKLNGYFVIPLSSLPPTGGLIFTGSSAIRLRSGKSEIELTGANLSFRNADITRIRWEMLNDMVTLDVHAQRELLVGPTYLTDAFRVLEVATANYILGKKADEKAG